MSKLPSGTVTFLFTDVEGSTRLLQELGEERYGEALAEHRRLLRQAFTRHDGVEVDTQGDAFFVAFSEAAAALAAAADAQAALAGGPMRIRIGVHTGRPHLASDGYVGVEVHRAARIAAAGHGGQVVVSEATAQAGGDGFPLVPLGAHRVPDFAEPVSLYQLGEGAFPALRTIANTNLPTPASSFLGREQELQEADGLLRQARLLTITGPGGAGKTRFALELARAARKERFSDYADGVFCCFLAALRDATLVLPAIAQMLSLREQAGRSAREPLQEHLVGKQILLLLDNLEHLLASAPDLSELLSACSGLTLVVTSRELLRIEGETQYELPPLREAEGVLLFCERASLEPTETIAELSRRLEGLPLAIELAAARMTSLSAEELLARLEPRLPLLSGGRRDAPERHRTLRATIAWSHDLLTPGEQRLFRRLSVFAGGCSLEAAEHVCDADLDSLQSLLDKSVLGRDGDRFTMLETIREYAHERLSDAGEADDLRHRHAHDFLQLAERIDEADWKAPALALVSRLEREQDNFRTALTWLRTCGDEESELRLVAALRLFWLIGGHLQEGRRWVDEAMPRVDGQAARLRARLLSLAAGIAGRRGEGEHAARMEERSLALHREAKDSKRAARSLMYLGALATRKGEFVRARELLEEGRTLSKEVGDRRTFAGIGINLGVLADTAGDRESAKRLYEEGFEVFDELEQPYGRRVALLGLGGFALDEDRLEEAETLAEASLRAVPPGVLSIEPFELLAAVAARRADGERAARLLGAAAAARERTGVALDREAHRVRKLATDEACGQLGDETFAALEAEGSAMTIGEAVELALR